MSKKRGTELAKIIWRPNRESSGNSGNGYDWRALGRHVRRVPQEHWESNMLFFGAKDEILKEYTGNFPATNIPGRTHPLFVNSPEGGAGHRVSPCSSKSGKRRQFIHQGCVLEPTTKIISRKTYVLKHLMFFLPKGRAWTRSLDFAGKVPNMCIRR